MTDVDDENHWDDGEISAILARGPRYQEGLQVIEIAMDCLGVDAGQLIAVRLVGDYFEIPVWRVVYTAVTGIHAVWVCAGPWIVLAANDGADQTSPFAPTGTMFGSAEEAATYLVGLLAIQPPVDPDGLTLSA